MNAFPAFILSGIIAAMAVPASAQAAESKVTYPAFNDGSHIHGPKLKASDLKGKVVFFEYWGINCPPCYRDKKKKQIYFHIYLLIFIWICDFFL